MPSKLKQFLQTWLINTLAVLVAVYLVRGIHYGKPTDLCAASLLLGILNAFIRPVLLLLTLPLLVVTLGLFLWIINAGLLYFTGMLLSPHFYVENFWAALWGALTISLVSMILNTLTGVGNSRIHVQRHPPPRNPGGGNGPVIDV